MSQAQLADDLAPPATEDVSQNPGATAEQHYLIALGSNMRSPRYGAPREVLGAAAAALEDEGAQVVARSPVIDTAPVGPSSRRFANMALVVQTERDPGPMLALLLRLERNFGRRRLGQSWGARPLDLDIVLWSGGIFASDSLAIPHPRFRQRHFVLGPAVTIAPDWRDPVTGLTVRQLHARLTRQRTLPR